MSWRAARTPRSSSRTASRRSSSATARGRRDAAPGGGGPSRAVVAPRRNLGVAGAQWASPRGWHRFSLGAGPAEALSRLTPEQRDGAAAMLAFEVLAREHLEVRFSGTLFESSGDLETQLGGVALDAVVFPWRGRLQPYVGAGVGAYQLIVEDGDPLAADRRRDSKSLAWTALVGARLRLGPVTPFVEWRRTEFDTEVPMRRYAPLVLGLHF